MLWLKTRLTTTIYRRVTFYWSPFTNASGTRLKFWTINTSVSMTINPSNEPTFLASMVCWILAYAATTHKMDFKFFQFENRWFSVSNRAEYSSIELASRYHFRRSSRNRWYRSSCQCTLPRRHSQTSRTQTRFFTLCPINFLKHSKLPESLSPHPYLSELCVYFFQIWWVVMFAQYIENFALFPLLSSSLPSLNGQQWCQIARFSVNWATFTKRLRFFCVWVRRLF